MAAAPEVAKAPVGAPSRRAFDVGRVREDFPILKAQVYGKPLVYLDNAATTQKPRAVLEAEQRFYLEQCSNVHRGVHYLSELATQAYENVRTKVQHFLNAAEAREIIFVRGTTEAINLVANTYGRKNIQAGDEIIISAMEHHSNIVPWQMLCEEKGAVLRVAPINDAGRAAAGGIREAAQPADPIRRRRRTCRTCWAPSIPCGRSSSRRTAGMFRCSWTAPRPRRT